MQPRQPFLHFPKRIRSRQDHGEKGTVPFQDEARAQRGGCIRLTAILNGR
jgi:hypothetical protein